MKRQLKRMSVLAFAIILALQPVSVVQASARSNAANVLKYYKKGDISKAKKYNKKLAKKASNKKAVKKGKSSIPQGSKLI